MNGSSVVDHSGLEEVFRESEQRFREMIDALPAAIYTTDAEGRLTHFNSAAIDFSGRVPVLGSDQWCVTWRLYHTDGRPMPHDQCPMAMTLKEGRTVRGEAIAERPDGRRIWFEAHPSPLYDDEGKLAGGINMLVDVTERRRTERLLFEQMRLLELIASDTRLNECLSSLCTAVSQLNPNAHGCVLVVDEERQSFQRPIAPELSPAFADALEGAPIAALSFGGLDEVGFGSAPTSYEDIANDEKWPEAWRDLWLLNGILAGSSTPIIGSHGQPLGYFFLCFGEPRAASEWELQLTTFGAYIASIAIERDRSNRALRESEKRYRALVEATTHMVWTTNAAGEFVAEQPDWAAYTGQTFEEYRGYGWAEALHPDARPRSELLWQRALSSGTLYENECRIRRHDGEYRWFAVRAAPVYDESGALREWIGTDTDITERKRAEEALRRSEARLANKLVDMERLHALSTRLLLQDDLEATLHEVMVASAELLHADKASVQVYDEQNDRLKLASFIGFDQEFARRFQNVDAGDFTTCAAALARGEPVLVEDLAADADFAEFSRLAIPYRVRAALSTPLRGSDGQFLGVFTMYWGDPHRPAEDELQLLDLYTQQAARYIERKLAEAALARVTAESEQQKRLYEAIISSTPDLVYVFDLNYRFTFVNQALLQMWGRTLADSVGKSLLEIGYEPWHAEMHEREIDQVIATKQPIRGEVPFPHATLGRRIYDYIFVPVLNHRGEVEAIAGTTRDVTERKWAEEALRYRTAQVETLVNQAPLGVYLVDADFRIREVNPVARPVFGDIPGGIIGRDFGEIIHVLWEKAYADELVRIFRHTLETGESYVAREDIELRIDRGVVEYYEWRLDRILLPDGRYGVVCYFRDISEQVQARKRIAESQAALRRLNESLEAQVAERTAALVKSEAQIRRMASRLTMAEQEERRRVAQVLHDDLQQQLYGVQMKLNFARHEAEAGNLQAALGSISDAEAWLREGIQSSRQLTVDLSPPILKSEGLADMLRWLVSQVQEMHDLKVMLETEHPIYIADEDMRVLLFQSVRELLFNVVKHASVNRATVELQENEGCLVIRVSDEGCGFEVQQVAARAEGESGFGLFSVRERLALFGGRMEIESEPGSGTCVTLKVPLYASR